MKRSTGGWLKDTFVSAFWEGLTLGLVGAATGTPGTVHGSSHIPFSACNVRVSIVDRETGDLLWTDGTGSEPFSMSAAQSKVEKLVARFIDHRGEERRH
jgi:hypothetical protein